MTLYTYFLYLYIINSIFIILLNYMEKKWVQKIFYILPILSYTLKNTLLGLPANPLC